MLEWGIDPLPTEAIHTPDGKEYKPGNLLYNFIPVVLYGMTKWSDLFNARQKLVLVILVENVKQAYHRMIKEDIDNNYAKAIISYLGLAVDRIADKNSMLCRLIPQTEAIGFTYSRQALSMLWDYIEMNAMEHSSGWDIIIKETLANLKHCSYFRNTYSTITQSSATSLTYSDNFFDAVFTDPPYYDNVPYADLSDFFYVWLKRTIGNLYPELFSTPNTPKSKEIIAELPLLRGMKKEEAALLIQGIKTKEKFEKMLKKSFQEIYRVLKPNGIVTIVYAHKSTEGWETLINSLIDSGLVVTASWPINTEMHARLRAQESAALASSIYIIARKMKRESTGFYNNIKEELKTYLYEKLERLWSEGISGADFFISAIGSAIEIFGKYEKIMDYEGNIIRASQMLSDVRRITTDYAVHQILHNGFAREISNLTRFTSYIAGVMEKQNYILMKRVYFLQAQILLWKKNGIGPVLSKKKRNFLGF